MGQPQLSDGATAVATLQPRKPAAGWVYIMTQPHHSRCKVGMTDLDPETRANQLYNGTGVPERFTVEYAVFALDNYRLEQAVLARLRAYRPNPGREFLSLGFTRLVEALEDCAGPNNPILFRVTSAGAMKRLAAVLRRRGLANAGDVSSHFRRYAHADHIYALAQQQQDRVMQAAKRVRATGVGGLILAGAGAAAPLAGVTLYGAMTSAHPSAYPLATGAGAGIAVLALWWRSARIRRLRDAFVDATRKAAVYFRGQLIEPGSTRPKPLVAILPIRPR